MAVRAARKKHKVEIKDSAPDLEVMRVVKARRVDPSAASYDALSILAEKSDAPFDAYLIQWKQHPVPTWIGKDGATAKLVAEWNAHRDSKPFHFDPADESAVQHTFLKSAQITFLLQQVMLHLAWVNNHRASNLSPSLSVKVPITNTVRLGRALNHAFPTELAHTSDIS